MRILKSGPEYQKTKVMAETVINGIRVQKLQRNFYRNGFSAWDGCTTKTVWITPDYTSGYYTTRTEAVAKAAELKKRIELRASNRARRP